MKTPDSRPCDGARSPFTAPLTPVSGQQTPLPVHSGQRTAEDSSSSSSPSFQNGYRQCLSDVREQLDALDPSAGETPPIPTPPAAAQGDDLPPYSYADFKFVETAAGWALVPPNWDAAKAYPSPPFPADKTPSPSIAPAEERPASSPFTPRESCSRELIDLQALACKVVALAEGDDRHGGTLSGLLSTITWKAFAKAVRAQSPMARAMEGAMNSADAQVLAAAAAETQRVESRASTPVSPTNEQKPTHSDAGIRNNCMIVDGVLKPYIHFQQHPYGAWVHYSDHARVVAELEAKLERACINLGATLKSAHVDIERVTQERNAYRVDLATATADIKRLTDFIAGRATPSPASEPVAAAGASTLMRAVPHAEVKAALETGLEHARTALAEHDTNLGRTTRKNEQWAETLEADVAALQKALGYFAGYAVSIDPGSPDGDFGAEATYERTPGGVARLVDVKFTTPWSPRVGDKVVDKKTGKSGVVSRQSFDGRWIVDYGDDWMNIHDASELRPLPR